MVFDEIENENPALELLDCIETSVEKFGYETVNFFLSNHKRLISVNVNTDDIGVDNCNSNCLFILVDSKLHIINLNNISEVMLS